MKCQDFEYCGNEHDDRYTMDYRDVEGGGFIYWCSTCGPLWTDVEKTLYEKMDSEPGFTEKFAKAVKEAEDKNKPLLN